MIVWYQLAIQLIGCYSFNHCFFWEVTFYTSTNASLRRIEQKICLLHSSPDLRLFCSRRENTLPFYTIQAIKHKFNFFAVSKIVLENQCTELKLIFKLLAVLQPHGKLFLIVTFWSNIDVFGSFLTTLVCVVIKPSMFVWSHIISAIMLHYPFVSLIESSI